MARQATAVRFWSKVEKTDSCWLWKGGTFNDGYGLFRINGKNAKAHRIAYELTSGPIPAKLLICHTCDTPSCVRPEHLFAGTHADNVHDCIRKGRRNTATGARHGIQRHPESYVTFRTMPRPKGEDNGQARLTWNLVREIRAKNAAGHSQHALAREYGVSRSTIQHIVTNRTWKERA